MKQQTRSDRVRALTDECGTLAALHEMMSGLAVALGSLVALEVERDDILRGARRCRQKWRETHANWLVAYEQRDAAIARAERAERLCVGYHDEAVKYCQTLYGAHREPLTLHDEVEAMRARVKP
jgi:hypothetical protein